MRVRNAILLCSVVVAICACASVGTAEVRVESGNQPSGFITRPLLLTTSSEESVRLVAQGICDNIKPGSDADITFVGKIPSPSPVSLGDWGRYRYDCHDAPPPVRRSYARPASAVPVPALPASAAAAPAAPNTAIPAGGTATGLDADEAHRRQCQRQQGSLQICMGSCLLGTSGSSANVDAECRQRCASLNPVGCQP